MDRMTETFPLVGTKIMLSKGKELSWNFREEAELVCAIEGSVRVIASDGFQAFTLRQGEGVFISPRTMNMIKSATDSSQIISLVFSPRILWQDTESPVYSKNIMPFMNAKEGLISLSAISAKKIEEIYNVISEKLFAYEIESRDMLSSIILFLIRERGENPEKVPVFKNERLLKMVSFIKENYREDIHLKDIASSALVSDREALRTFQKSLGVSPVQFLITHRLSAGARLLEISQYNIEEISDKIGFESPSHFSRLFKRAYSLTPTQYRKQLNQA